MNVNFEWDEDKGVSNLRKHGISFEEGATVFTDPLSLTISDPPLSIRDPVCRHWTVD
ncbi:MAG: BrnT family toxin [Thermoanaerobaculia bacterium]